MDFSVVIPAYNCEKTILQTVQSICNVKLEKMEVIIVDDGSSDGTCEVCKAITTKFPIVKYFYQKNAGVSAARNFGISKSVGKYILLWDSDDQADTNLLKKCMLTALAQNADLLIFGMSFHRKYNGKLFEIDNLCCEKSERISKEFLGEKIVDLFNINYLQSGCNKILKRKICQNVRFNSSKMSFEDFLYTLEYLCYCESIYIMPELAYIYSIDYSSSKPTREKRIDDFNEYMQEFQIAVINLEETLGVSLNLLRSKLINIYEWMLNNKLLVSNLTELKKMDKNKMQLYLFGKHYKAETKICNLFFLNKLVTLRAYSLYRNFRHELSLELRCMRYKCKNGEKI